MSDTTVTFGRNTPKIATISSAMRMQDRLEEPLPPRPPPPRPLPPLRERSSPLALKESPPWVLPCPLLLLPLPLLLLLLLLPLLLLLSAPFNSNARRAAARDPTGW